MSKEEITTKLIGFLSVSKDWILTFILTLAIFFAGYFILVSFFYPAMSERGQFGDMFGGLNALFSGLAFLGVIYAVLLQREELSLQRKELELTRQELKRTAEAQEKSERALSKQAASLKINAQLNGLSAILQHDNTLIEMTNSARHGINVAVFDAHKREADQIIEKIKKLIEDK